MTATLPRNPLGRDPKSLVAPQGQQPGSAIVNTASIEAFKANPTLAAHASTPCVIVAFTTSLAQQLGCCRGATRSAPAKRDAGL